MPSIAEKCNEMHLATGSEKESEEKAASGNALAISLHRNRKQKLRDFAAEIAKGILFNITTSAAEVK